MEGPDESKAGLNVIAEVCWEPTLLVSLSGRGKVGEKEAGRGVGNEPRLVVYFEEVEAGDWEVDCHYGIPLLWKTSE